MARARQFAMLLLLPPFALPAPEVFNMTGCRPGSLSMWYNETFYILDYEGEAYGWDTSDPRWRFPHKNFVDGLPGGETITIFTHPISGASLYLGSKHTAYYDTEYLNESCLNVKALVNLDKDIPQVPEQPTAPAWDIASTEWGVPIYPIYTPSPARVLPRGPVPSFAQISLPEDGWFFFWDTIETWIDEQLAAGNNTLIYDVTGPGCGPGEREDEYCVQPNCNGVFPNTCGPDDFPHSCGPDCNGCGGAASIAIAYSMRKDDVSLLDAYNELHAVRPCIEALTAMEEREIMGLIAHSYTSWLQRLETRFAIEKNETVYAFGKLGSETCPSGYAFVMTEPECDTARQRLGAQYNGESHGKLHDGRLPYCWLQPGGKAPTANFNPHADSGNTKARSKLICKIVPGR